MPESDMPAEHGGATEVHFAGLHHDRFVQRLMVKLVILAEKDSEQDRIPGNLHRHIHLSVVLISSR
jgi:hypothetical protein